MHYVGTTISNVIHRSTGQVALKLCIDVFDKRKEFPFTVRLYPSMSSLIPSTIPYGVFTGQLYRYHSICSEPSAFLNHAVRIADVLVERGCEMKKLQRKFTDFINGKYSKKQNESKFIMKYPRLDKFKMIHEFEKMKRGTPRESLLPTAASSPPPPSPPPPLPIFSSRSISSAASSSLLRLQ